MNDLYKKSVRQRLEKQK